MGVPFPQGSQQSSADRVGRGDHASVGSDHGGVRWQGGRGGSGAMVKETTKREGGEGGRREKAQGRVGKKVDGEEREVRRWQAEW